MRPSPDALARALEELRAAAPPEAGAWPLDPGVVFLNHGSFGACPEVVLAEQSRLRRRMEAEPVRFFVRELEALWDAARERLAAVLGTTGAALAFVPNATTGVNTGLAALDLGPGDEVLLTDHEYNASANAARRVAERAGAGVRLVPLPYPLSGPDEVVERLQDAVGERTRALLVDQVTSQTGLVLPVERLVPALRERGVETVVDAAHAPGQVDVDLDALGAAFWTGNCHKWLCTPKGSAVLYVREDLRERARPMVTSHGANSLRRDRSRFHLEHDWVGTDDPTPWLAIPAALDFLESLGPGGLAGLRDRNRALALEARGLLCEALGQEPPCPDSMVGALAALPLPDSDAAPTDAVSSQSGALDPLQEALFAHWAIEVPVIGWPGAPRRLVRVSAQAYNHRAQYQWLAHALRAELGLDG